MMKFKLTFVLYILIGTLITLGVPSLGDRAIAADPVPANLAACMPTTRVPITRTELIGKTVYQSQTYSLYATYQGQTPNYFPLIVSTDSSGEECQEEFYNPMGDDIAFSSVIPQPVANQLKLSEYRREIAKVGRDQFVRGVNQFLQNTSARKLYPEEAWALDQLSINVPR
jgi:hypothetical protein